MIGTTCNTGASLVYYVEFYVRR